MNDERTILDVLGEQRRGFFVADATRALSEAVTAVIQHPKAGDPKSSIKAKVAITLTVSCEGTSPSGTPIVHMADEIAVKTPKVDHPISVFFADEQAALLRQDPAQMFTAKEA